MELAFVPRKRVRYQMSKGWHVHPEGRLTDWAVLMHYVGTPCEMPYGATLNNIQRAAISRGEMTRGKPQRRRMDGVR